MANHRTPVDSDFISFVTDATYGKLLSCDDKFNLIDGISDLTQFIRVGNSYVCYRCGHRIGSSTHHQRGLGNHNCSAEEVWDHTSPTDWSWNKWADFATRASRHIDRNADAYARIVSKTWTEDGANNSNDPQTPVELAESRRRIVTNVGVIRAKRGTNDKGLTGYLVCAADKANLLGSYVDRIDDLFTELADCQLNPQHSHKSADAKLTAAGIPDRVILKAVFGNTPIQVILAERPDHVAHLYLTPRTLADMVNMVRRLCHAGEPGNVINMRQGVGLATLEDRLRNRAVTAFEHLTHDTVFGTETGSNIAPTSGKASIEPEKLLKWSQ
nr:outer clamp [Largemouth bass reovirus]